MHRLLTVYTFVLLAVTVVASPREGSGEAANAYRNRPLSAEAAKAQGFKLINFASPALIDLASSRRADAVARREKEKYHRGNGLKTGNICGYYATVRLSVLCQGIDAVEHTPPRFGHIFNTRWTEPDQLVDYLRRDTAHNVHRDAYSTGDYFQYMRQVKRDIDEDDAVVVLFCLGKATALHFVVVVGYLNHPGDREGRADFLVLDYGGTYRVTENEFYRMSYNPWPFHKAYNAIRVDGACPNQQRPRAVASREESHRQKLNQKPQREENERAAGETLSELEREAVQLERDLGEQRAKTEAEWKVAHNRALKVRRLAKQLQRQRQHMGHEGTGAAEGDDVADVSKTAEHAEQRTGSTLDEARRDAAALRAHVEALRTMLRDEQQRTDAYSSKAAQLDSKARELEDDLNAILQEQHIHVQAETDSGDL